MHIFAEVRKRFGGPGGIRTHDLRIKSPLLCLTELQAPALYIMPLQNQSRIREMHMCVYIDSNFDNQITHNIQRS